MQLNPTIYQILYQLKSLEYLDLSTDNNNNNSLIDIEYDINKFLSEENCLPNLKHFDISGQKKILSKCLYQFLLISFKSYNFLVYF